ncbi:MAG: hypothetical protein KKD18_03105 [Nanoarchaeota archaeon]|nr:hypothetical protein [Nanoarchaeota archaeon]
MKLDKDTPKEMNLEQSVYERIAEEFGGEIPVVKSNPKDETVTRIGFDVMLRLKNIAEKICLENRKKFPTPTEFHRAAYYLGTSILYHMFFDGRHNCKGQILYEALKKCEKSMEIMDELNSILMTTKRVFEALNLKLITKGKAEKEISDLLDAVPEHLVLVITEHIENQRRSMEVVEISGYFRKRGRPGN